MRGGGKRCRSNVAADDALERIERELDASIRSQKERLSQMDKLFNAKAEAVPWRLAAVGATGIALLCAWRLQRDKRQYEVRFLATAATGSMAGTCSALK